MMQIKLKNLSAACILMIESLEYHGGFWEISQPSLMYLFGHLGYMYAVRRFADRHGGSASCREDPVSPIGVLPIIFKVRLHPLDLGHPRPPINPIKETAISALVVISHS